MTREDGKRPDGMTIFPWKRGKSIVWDATCVDTLAKTYLNQTATIAGAAANRAERKNRETYERSKSFLIQRVGIEVQRGNAASVLGTLREGDALHEIFYL